MASLGRTAGSFNAGILSGRKPWHTLTKAEVERFVEVNYVGYFLVTKAVYALLKKSQTPRVIMVASRRISGQPGADRVRGQQRRGDGDDARAGERDGRRRHSGERSDACPRWLPILLPLTRFLSNPVSRPRLADMSGRTMASSGSASFRRATTHTARPVVQGTAPGTVTA